VDFDGISREIDLLNGNNDAPPTPDFARSRGRQALMRARDSLGLAKHMQMKKFQRNVSDQSAMFDESARTALESLTPVAPKRLKMDSEEPPNDSLGSIQATLPFVQYIMMETGLSSPRIQALEYYRASHLAAPPSPFSIAWAQPA
jgi:hypothetical protein